jgi:sugar diacid utilization regulator
VRIEGRLVAVARPRQDVVGVLFLIDPDGSAGEAEIVALEHGATVLAIELARLLSLAETELRLGVDVVADLVGGTDVAGASRRAEALGRDLSRPHRVVVIGASRQQPDPDSLVRAVRGALSGAHQPLLMQRGETVVLLLEVRSADDRSFLPGLVAGLRAAPGGRSLHVGVGGVCLGPDDYPRSYREGRLALRIPEGSGQREAAVVYDDLGVYQLLSEVSDLSGVDAFVRRWLGALLDYDERRGSALVLTLSHYLDAGGRYDTAAGTLAIGRSTLRYRLSRIRELSGHDLAEADTRFQLHLATKAWLTRRALSGP